MYEALLVPIICMLAGSFFVVRNLLHILHQDKLLHYLNTSPKAICLVKHVGIDKAATIAKRYLLPIGMLVGLAILGVGITSLTVIASA
ncbi:hypothetical protein [Thalassotalea maritima]|uniref:hypothetical protein n=1 Tax=Thalassotalea maritima TaxID=3242416 RepID=UPI003528F4FF